MPDLKLTVAVESGTVYTPSGLANAVVDRLIAIEPNLGDRGLWLEPSAGGGVFVAAAARVGIPRNRLTAVELNPDVSAVDSLAKTIRGVDFLEWARKTESRFDAIIGNPPYIPIDRLPGALRPEALRVRDLFGSRVPASSNYWLSFLLASISLLDPNGSLAFVLPAAWDYADYAASTRAVIPMLFRRVEIFRSRRPLFDDVQDGAVVLMAYGRGAGPGSFHRVDARDRDELISALRGFPKRHAVRRKRTARNSDSQLVRFGDIFDIRIGAVTGDSKFFLMNEKRRVELNLPSTSFVPVLTKSKHLRSPFISRVDWKSMCSSGERVLLFRPNASALRNSNVKRYLSLPPERGGCDRTRLKVINRKLWHEVPLPRAPHAFMSGMSSRGPFMVLNRMRGLNASNTLYAVRSRQTNISVAQLSSWALSLLTSVVRSQVRRRSRIYPEQLRKLEPSDIASFRVPIPPKKSGAKAAYAAALKALLAGKQREAVAIADNWLYS